MTGMYQDKLKYLPVGLDVKGKPCLVVGGGTVGTRKVFNLIRAEADVTVVSPEVTRELDELAQSQRICWVRESFQDHHLGDAFLVIAATDDEALNAAIVQSAARRGALVCDASSAERSEVIFGALLVDDDVTVAVFTDGRDPARARQTRDRIADLMTATRESHPEA